MGKYVLCHKCHLPEIDMVIKRGVVGAKCAACGWAGHLDNSHKLAKFIVANPPDTGGLNVIASDASGSGGKKERQARKAEKAASLAGKKDEADLDVATATDSEDNSVKEKKDKKEKKEKKDKKDKK